jgi:hypothetical protein
MNTFKWVMCGYDHWFFIIYNNEESFVGWYNSIGDYLDFYTTHDLIGLYSNAKSYHGQHHSRITSNEWVAKKQWKGMTKVSKRKIRRQMIRGIL